MVLVRSVNFEKGWETTLLVVLVTVSSGGVPKEKIIMIKVFPLESHLKNRRQNNCRRKKMFWIAIAAAL